MLTILTGIAYPIAVTAIARLAFPKKSIGSLMKANGKPIGSELIGQPFTSPGYFWSRPSACDYNGTSSSGSNLGPTNDDLTSVVLSRVEFLRAAGPDKESRVPVDLVTASGSGLDPHISPAAANYQVERIARERGIPAAKIRELIAIHIQGRTFGLLGEPRVNVLQLNLSLDSLIAK
ncbi:MAG: potassium-transporting ATPase subunit KdpC [Candidatus Sumerlaeaceae bacterium]|nr:potassium-transporting ATPase subunit KdpC [Candidatus Sumerlaeaceae bacterium]